MNMRQACKPEAQHQTFPAAGLLMHKGVGLATAIIIRSSNRMEGLMEYIQRAPRVIQVGVACPSKLSDISMEVIFIGSMASWSHPDSGMHA